MGIEPHFASLMGELKAATVERVDKIERSINELCLERRRPGSEIYVDDRTPERKDAIGLCETRHMLTVPKMMASWLRIRHPPQRSTMRSAPGRRSRNCSGTPILDG